MDRKLKALGLALIAAFAFTAITASVAGATEDPEFLGAPTAFGTSNEAGNIVVDVFGGELRCSHAEFSLTRLASPNRGTVEPSYRECDGFGLPITANFTSCDVAFEVEETATETDYEGTVDITCEQAGDAIEVTVFGSAQGHSEWSPICHVNFPEQEGLAILAFDNVEGHVRVSGTVTGLKATQERTSFFCPSGETTEEAEFTINQPITLEGRNHEGVAEEIEVG